jgi:ribose/xylose/arabinose/galactoside ABC-type transport system permease subunit
VGAVIAGRFAAHVHGALDRTHAAAGYRAAVANAAHSTLVTQPSAYFTGPTRTLVHRSLESASIDAFHTSMLLAAILAFVAGGLSLVGIANRPASP